MAYRADIEIAVRGARQLKDLQNQLLTTADTVSALDGNLKAVANQLPRSISNLKNLASQAAESFNKVALNTGEAIDAAKDYIKTTDELNEGLRERLNLVRSIRATETAAQRRVTPGDAGYGQQTPALPPSMVRLEEIKQNWNKFFLDAAGTATDIQQQTAANRLNVKTSWVKFFDSAAEAADNAKQETVANQLNVKTSWTTFFNSAAEVAKDIKQETIANRLNVKTSWVKFFDGAATLAEDLTAQIRATEAAASVAARKRLAATTNKVVDPRGKQAAKFPFGPQPLIGGASRFGAVSNEEIDAAMLRGMKRRRKEFYAWEAKQPRNIYTAYDRNFFAPAISRFNDLARAAKTTGAQITKSIGKRLGGAAIGGSFPLLFGQGPEAAIGGALGGLLGGPGAGGFAGSLIGTALGELVAAQDRIKELGLELGFSATQTTELAKAFELAGKNSEQLQAAVTNIQGLGLSTEETASAIKISSELAQEYGGKVDKIAQAFANTLESGKVSISTLNAFTAQGLPIQDELAKKLNVSKTTLLEMAKDGKVAVQDVIDVLVDMGRAAEKTADNSRTGFDEFTSSVKELATAIADAAGVLLKTLVPALDTVLTKLASIITDATRAISLLTDVQVGGLAKAISSSSGFRSTGFSSKTNIDAITRELKALNPALAQNSNDIVKYRKVLENARVELSKYNGQLGEYSVNTAQRALSAAQVALNARERALPKEPLSTPIKGITAPTQLSPSGKGDTSRDKAADNLRRAQNFLRALEQQSALLETQTKLDEEILKISQEYEENLLKISELEDQSLRTAQEDAALRIRNQQINDVVEKQEKKRLESLDKELEKYKKIDAVRKVAYEGYAKAEVVNLQELTLQAEILKAAFENIGRSFSSSVAEVVGGTKTIKEAVADMFGALGRALIEYATQAIATYIAIGIARIFAGVGGVEQANYTGNEMGGAFINPSFGVDSSGLAGPSSAFSSLDYAGVKFAQGGFVTGPTRAVVGEGGEPEYVIPASKMRGAMNRYAAGARGSAVIPSGGDEGGMGGTATAAPAAIDVRYTVERINTVDYVTADQFRSGMQQAAQQGAQQGEQRTLRRLQMSTSTRKRLGM